MEVYDDVNNPRHYTEYYPLQPIDVIENTQMSYNLGQIFKYLVRAPYKNNELEDLKKAKYYVKLLKSEEIKNFLNFPFSKKYIYEFFEKALDKNALSPFIFFNAFDESFANKDDQSFVKLLKEQIESRIEYLS
ncbi:DUF3310 domain-containing protein [Xylocopilactobacillus apis]|uniref:DUF3310 domain-containing protein n=1 Tax=Xylocopilactobacillus apis TaxID=2932183 RepID=A0AAU9DID1_9LACO|nr:DUF3310 domain-containing protein [Xylocopilactobacillus apis]BDR56517.1 hypothetical protein KIMC2_10790 [Xylocopilactobacillus apis]